MQCSDTAMATFEHAADCIVRTLGNRESVDLQATFECGDFVLRSKVIWLTVPWAGTGKNECVLS